MVFTKKVVTLKPRLTDATQGGMAHVVLRLAPAGLATMINFKFDFTFKAWSHNLIQLSNLGAEIFQNV